MAMNVGVVSETHGLLGAEAIEFLRGSEHIIHAGDIGSPEIVPALEKIAPGTAIRGNVDEQEWAGSFAERGVVALQGFHLYVLHDVNALDLNPKAAGFAAVTSGHSHKPAQATRDGVLYFNPGSAGPRRFSLPVSVGRLEIGPEGIRGSLHTLEVRI